ncbi:universal stress protein [Curtobacterium pusillum]|uniref:universal stress protein n=1 Tax=Curtobacterium pusillum TaxID=69373 RepID=UPI0016436C40|nr:universal stress protein [Curtobacterium pusillum]
MLHGAVATVPQHLVVGIDEHEASLRAIDWVAGRDLPPGSRVDIVTVTNGWATDPLTDRARVESAAARFAARNGVDVESQVRFGAPDRTLIEAATDADLLVIGNRRQHRLRTALDGWMPERVPTVADLPVVVVPEDWEPVNGDVLLGVDTATGDAALRFAAEEALRSRRRLSALRAWKLPVATATGALSVLEDPQLYEDHNRAVLADSERLLHLRYPGLRHRPLLEEGDPAARLLAHAPFASLVVVGRRHRTTLGGVFTGSTAHGLITQGRTPVAVVPQRRRGLVDR